MNEIHSSIHSPLPQNKISSGIFEFSNFLSQNLFRKFFSNFLFLSFKKNKKIICGLWRLAKKLNSTFLPNWKTGMERVLETTPTPDGYQSGHQSPIITLLRKQIPEFHILSGLSKLNCLIIIHNHGSQKIPNILLKVSSLRQFFHETWWWFFWEFLKYP